MNKEDLLSIYTSSSLIQNLSFNSEEIKNINGLSGSQLAFISSSLYLNKQVDFFYIFQKKESALLFKNDFENLSNEKTLFFFQIITKFLIKKFLKILSQFIL